MQNPDSDSGSRQFFPKAVSEQLSHTLAQETISRILHESVLRDLKKLEKPLQEIHRVVRERIPNAKRAQLPALLTDIAMSWRQFQIESIVFSVHLLELSTKYPQLAPLYRAWAFLNEPLYIELKEDDFKDNPNPSLDQVVQVYIKFTTFKTLVESMIAFDEAPGILAIAVMYMREASLAPHLEEIEKAREKSQHIEQTVEPFRSTLTAYINALSVARDSYLLDVVQTKEPRMKQAMFARIVGIWEDFKSIVLPYLHETLDQAVADLPELVTERYREEFLQAWKRVAKLRFLSVSTDIEDGNNLKVLALAIEALSDVRSKVDAAVERAQLRTIHPARKTFAKVIGDS